MYNLFFISLRYLRGKKKFTINREYYLAFWGVSISVALFVVVTSVIAGFQKEITSSFYNFKPHIRIVSNEDTSKIYHYQDWTKRIQSVLKDEYEEIEGHIFSPAIFRVNRRVSHIFIQTKDFQQTTNSSQKTKKYIIPKNFINIKSPNTIKQFPKGNNCFIGTEMARLYSLEIGNSIEIIVPKGQFFTELGVEPSIQFFKIVGIFESGNAQFDTNFVILPLQETQKLFQIEKNATQQIVVRMKNTKKIQKTRDTLIKILPFSYDAYTIEDEERSFFSALKLEKTILGIIMFLFIIIAAFLVAFTTFNIVHSKKTDIGILKAIGYTKNKIFFIFSFNNTLVSFLGILFGLLLGILLSSNLDLIVKNIEKTINIIGHYFYKDDWMIRELIPKDVYYFNEIPIFFSKITIISTLICSFVLCTLSTIIPAVIASKTTTINIIRNRE